jgi:ABC-type antimicrobial peptide transport system permease subunit
MAAVALAIAAIAAVYGPARRASRIDPIAMLR